MPVVNIKNDNESIRVDIKLCVRNDSQVKNRPLIYIKHMPKPDESMVSGSGNYIQMKIPKGLQLDVDSLCNYVSSKMGVSGLNRSLSFEPAYKDEKRELIESAEGMPPLMVSYVEKKLNEFCKKAWHTYLKKLRAIKKMTSSRTEYIEGLERKQSSVGPEGNMGIFATKDYKRGDIITRYGVHGILFMNECGRLFMEYDKEIMPFEIFDENNTLTNEMIEYFTRWRVQKYWASVRTDGGDDGEGEGVTSKSYKDSRVSILGLPDPELNKDSRFWGHLINDLNFEEGITTSPQEYIDNAKNNVCIGSQGQDCQKLPDCHRFKASSMPQQLMGGTDHEDFVIKECGKLYDRVNIIAFKDIKAGDELGTSYGATYWLGHHVMGEQNMPDSIREGMEDFDNQYGLLIPGGCGIFIDPRREQLYRNPEEIEYWNNRIGRSRNPLAC